MKYRESQRNKAVELRNKLFRDPGNGIFMGKEREFVLEDPILNLWEGIRFDAVDYFRRNNISWWKGKTEEPSGHLLSSQIACINHLYFLRQRQDAATHILKNIDSDVDKACVVDDGFVEFEFIGEKQYLKERGFTRGANCTSVDAVMIGLLKTGEKRLYLIEWKYTEEYASEDKYIPERASVYDPLLTSSDSPFIDTVDVRGFYFEPFYQLMRQTLLAEQCVKNNDHGVASYRHLHIVPEENVELKTKITSTYFSGRDIHEVWMNTLKNKSNFIPISPKEYIEPVKSLKDTLSITEYLKGRYWL